MGNEGLNEGGNDAGTINHTNIAPLALDYGVLCVKEGGEVVDFKRRVDILESKAWRGEEGDGGGSKVEQGVLNVEEL